MNYQQSPNWKEALKILKLVVTRSSSLQVVPQQSESSSAYANLHASYSDSEMFCKKELAGRTMEFSFDVSQTPLIGRKILLKSDGDSTIVAAAAAQFSKNGGGGMGVGGGHYGGHAGTPNSPRRSASLSPADTAPLSGWKRPWMSQVSWIGVWRVIWVCVGDLPISWRNFVVILNTEYTFFALFWFIWLHFLEK